MGLHCTNINPRAFAQSGFELRKEVHILNPSKREWILFLNENISEFVYNNVLMIKIVGNNLPYGMPDTWEDITVHPIGIRGKQTTEFQDVLLCSV